MIHRETADLKAQSGLKVSNRSLRSHYSDKALTKPLPSRLRPQDFTIDLTKLAVGKSYRGPCRVESFSGDYGRNEPMIVFHPPYEGRQFDLLVERDNASLYKALVELSERVYSAGDLGDEALGICYAPSDRAIALTQRFVETFGLLKWGRRAGCDCVGDQARLGEVETPWTIRRVVEQLQSVERKLSLLAKLDADDSNDPGDEATFGIDLPKSHPLVAILLSSNSELPLGDWISARTPELSHLEPDELRTIRRDVLQKEKARLQEEIEQEVTKAKRAKTEQASKNEQSGYHYISGRFHRLHADFFNSNPDVEHANSVAWILQEALSLRRAAAVWEALRRYQLGEGSDVVAALWRRRSHGRLSLFDQTSAPLKPARSRLLQLTYTLLPRVINAHIWDVHTEAAYVFPQGSTFERTDWRKAKASVVLRPQTPLAAAWLQLYDDILNDRASGRICHECREIYDPTRSDQVFCSSKCSNRYHQRAYRSRRRT